MNGLPIKKESNFYQSSYFFAGLMCLLLAAVLLFPLRSPVDGYFNQQSLVQSNEGYLLNMVEKERSELLLLSEINGFLSLIQSSELGVSFLLDAKIQVGNILNPLTDITQQSFNSTLSSLHLTHGLKKVLALVDWLVLKVAICFLLILALYCGAKFKKQPSNLANHLKPILEKLVLILLTLHLLIPYSLYLSSKIDISLYQSFSEEAKDDLKNLHQTLVSDKNKNGLIERTEYFIKNLERMLLDIPKKTEALISYHSNQVVLTILRIVIMPGTILFLLFFLTRFYIKRLSRLNVTSPL